jgi:predicted ribosomally synthesized peptide with SipW-like signal peptide
LAVALLAIVVSGTLAYFTDTDEVTNTFTVGSVLIEIYENEKATDSDTIEFVERLTPVVNADPSQDESYITKAVKVQNTGLNAAYIRTCLAIPTNLVGYLELDVSTDWVKVAEATGTKDGIAYTVYIYDYSAEVAPNAFTPDLLKGVYLASDVDLEADSNGSLWFVKKTNGEITDRSGFLAHTKTANGYTSNTVNVLVASQAIQAQGFADATTALNTGFPQNPWAE